MENKKKLSGIEKNFLRSLNRNAQTVQKQKSRIVEKVNKFVSDNQVKVDELNKMLNDIDASIKSYTGGLSFKEYFKDEKVEEALSEEEESLFQPVQTSTMDLDNPTTEGISNHSYTGDYEVINDSEIPESISDTHVENSL